MLQAVIRKKFATAPDAAADDTSAGINAKREDTLTSTVLGLLLQLPDKLLWQVIRQASTPAQLPEDSGELLSYEFWPHWSAAGIQNYDGSERRFVEPDFFLQFAHCDLIGEAKYGSLQYEQQWDHEVRAYHNDYGRDKLCFLLAIGGNNGAPKLGAPKIHGVYVIRLEWYELLQALQCVPVGQDVSVKGSIKRTLQFLQQALAYFGLANFSFLEELQPWNEVDIAATAAGFCNPHQFHSSYTTSLFLESLAPYNHLELTVTPRGTVFKSPCSQLFLEELQRWNDVDMAATANTGLITGDFT